MNIREIKEGILYCGVNDRVTDRFEGLWPLPFGVSYNSYIVKGTEKIALVDTVEIGELSSYRKAIKNLIGDSGVDYIIVNHMEPDHTGSLPLMSDAYPEARIVGNKQTLGMIKGFYPTIPSERLMEIADGATLELGGKTLRFHLTPMVHWPETMMTYVVEDKVLFSGDAFGTFGALNGGVIDTEMETGWYDDEMYRYYSNIVGKYGKFVMRAIDKLKDVPLEFICPTHGPVWHERIARVVEIYSGLAQYKGEPGVTIIYGSMYGNTAEVAEEIARQLAARGVRTIKIHNASKSNMSYMISDAFRYEGLIVGGPTYSMHLFPPLEDFMIAMETREIKNKVIATFGSFTWAPAAEAKLRTYVNQLGQDPVDSFTMKQAPGVDTQAAIERLADNFVEALKNRSSAVNS